MKTKTFIPFQGFYYTIYDAEFDYLLGQNVENLAQYHDVDEGDICDLLHKHIDWKKAHENLAKYYVTYFNDYTKDETFVNLGLTFVELVSPKFYNFVTDRIICEIPLESVEKLIGLTPNKTLEDMIRERHTSRSGFHSFYSNDIHYWLSKTLEDYDANEVETLLMSWIKHHLEEDWQYAVFEQMCDDGVFYDVLDQAGDWPTLEEELEKLEKVHD